MCLYSTQVYLYTGPDMDERVVDKKYFVFGPYPVGGQNHAMAASFFYGGPLQCTERIETRTLLPQILPVKKEGVKGWIQGTSM